MPFSTRSYRAVCEKIAKKEWSVSHRFFPYLLLKNAVKLGCDSNGTAVDRPQSMGTR